MCEIMTRMEMVQRMINDVGNINSVMLYSVKNGDVTLLRFIKNLDDVGQLGYAIIYTECLLCSMNHFSIRNNIWNTTMEIIKENSRSLLSDKYEEDDIAEVVDKFLNLDGDAVHYMMLGRETAVSALSSENDGLYYVCFEGEECPDTVSMKFKCTLDVPSNQITTNCELIKYFMQHKNEVKDEDLDIDEYVRLSNARQLKTTSEEIPFSLEERVEFSSSESELEQDLWEIICDYGMFCGLKLDKDNPDFAITKEVEQIIINIIEALSGRSFQAM